MLLIPGEAPEGSVIRAKFGSYYITSVRFCNPVFIRRRFAYSQLRTLFELLNEPSNCFVQARVETGSFGKVQLFSNFSRI